MKARVGFALERFAGNPILSPNPDNGWESAVSTNPGAYFDEESGEVKMLYRASAADEIHQVHLGLATSKDGYNFKRVSDSPAVSPSDGFDEGCVEDPRIVRFGEWYYVVYASRPYPAGQYWTRLPHAAWKPPYATDDWPVSLRENLSSSGLLLSKDLKKFKRAGRITDPRIDDRDAILFPEKIQGQFVLLHRPMSWTGPGYGTDKPAMWIAYSDDPMRFEGSRLLAKAEFSWERKIGGSTPPLRTPDGWLTIYHAVGDDLRYRIGALLLDLEQPHLVRYRTPEPLLEPEESYEFDGFYKGCIFPCGNIVINGKLFVYYGAADKYVGLATCQLSALLDYLKENPANL